MQGKHLSKDVFKFIFFIAIAALLIWIFIQKLTIEQRGEIIDSFKRANYWWLLPAFIVGVISHVLRSWRWKMLLVPMGYKPRMWNVISAVCIAYFANLAIPRLGEIARCGILTKYEKIPFSKSIGTVITERAIDMLVFVILFVANIIVQRHVVLDAFLNLNTGKTSTGNGAKIIVAGVVILLIVIFFVVMRHYRKSHPDSKIVNKVSKTVKGFADGLKSVFHTDKPVSFIMSSILIWVCYLYMTKFVFRCLPETAELGYNAAFSSMVFCTIATILLPGGIGAYPVIASMILALYGVSETIGFAMGWMIWTNQTVLIILAGLFSLIFLPLYNKVGHKNKEII